MDINITLILPMLLIIEVGTVIIIVGTTLTLLMPGQLLDGSNHQVAGGTILTMMVVHELAGKPLIITNITLI
nr:MULTISPECIES: hypothetical protein [Limosilactobacillus]